MMMAVNISSGDDVGGSKGKIQARWKSVNDSSAKESVVVDGKVVANASNVKLLNA